MTQQNIEISGCARFLSASLVNNWDIEQLKTLVFQARSMQKFHRINRIIITTGKWLNHVENMETILSVGDVFARMNDTDWKVAIVDAHNFKNNNALEDVLSLKGIELKHFDNSADAENWLLG